MATIGASSASNNAFGFSLQTSSGDVINLSMYDTRTTDISQETNGNTRTTTLSLSHAYGYNFQYQGDGIDANDQKEIDEAMKAIQPMMDKYLQSVKESATNQAQITNSAFDISSKLPTTTNPNTQNYINDSVLKTLDKVLSKAQHQNEKTLNEAQKLFDAFLKQHKGFNLYM